MRKLIRFVLVLALGAVIGYFLTPSIDSLLGKQDVVNVDKVDALKEKANTKVDSALNK